MNRVWWASAQVLVLSRTLCSGSFGDILKAAWGGPLMYTEGFSEAQDLHTIAYVLFCSGGSVCNSPILSSNIIYMGILIIRLSDLLLYALCICIHYLLSVALTFILTL